MLTGVVEEITETKIRGWAYSSETPQQALALEVLLGNKVIAHGLADQHRDDLQMAGIGTGHHAFEFNFLSGQLKKSSAKPSVRIAGTHAVLPLLSDIQAAQANHRQPRGVLEASSATEVRGWAFLPSAPETILTVEVLVKGKVVMSGPADVARADLKDAGIGDGRHGFELRLPRKGVPPGSQPQVRIQGQSSFLPSLSDLNPASPPPDASMKSAPQGVVEQISEAEIAGWAFNPQQPDTPLELEVLLDSEIIATGVAKQKRIDLVKAGIGNGHHAFYIDLPAGRIKAGQTPEVRVRGTGVILPYVGEVQDQGVAEPEPVAAKPAPRQAAQPPKPKSKTAAIESSPFFDYIWYRNTYLNGKGEAADCVAHYLTIGAQKLFDPGPDFNTAYYLKRYPDVARVGVNPLVHYLSAGRKEGRHPNANWGNFALLIHAFHLDVLPDLARHVAYFPEGADQFVTYPEDYSAEQQQIIQQHFPKARLVGVKNIGQDVGALMQLADAVNLRNYGFICKIHSKKGPKLPMQWRRILLQGTLGSAAQVRNTIRTFQHNALVSLAAPKQLFIYGPNNLGRNEENIKQHFPEIVGDTNLEKLDWGFVGGTCFWARTSILLRICERLRDAGLSPSAYKDDGTPAHAAERMFGLIPALLGDAILLNDAINTSAAGTLTHGFPQDLNRGMFTAVKWLNTPRILQATSTEVIAPASVPGSAPVRISGDLNLDPERPIFSGWLALKGDARPREALVRCGELELRVMAETLRGDLKKNGINEGKHAFYVTAPSHLMDGKSREAILLDAETGQEVSRKTCLWQRPKRDYINFDGFLKSSMTRPVTEAPFVEEDKRCFAVMENIANQLSRVALSLKKPPLVSVIMPVYNREQLVSKAIRSVLNQTYKNFELLIIDDGSSDDSATVIKSFKNKRVKPIFLKRNKGHSAARNMGLAAAKGQIIAYLDSDNLWDERYLAATVGAYETLPQAAALYSGQLLYRGASPEPYAVRYGHFNRALLENQNYIDLNSFSHRPFINEQPVRFDETLRRFVDYDLIMRVSESATMMSVPILLCSYFLDKADNTVTGNDKHFGDLEIVRNRLSERTKTRLRALQKNRLKQHATVVIPNWQSLDDIQDCLAALTTPRWGNQLDIVVVDNASDKAVTSYLRAEHKAGRIKLILNKRNFGFTYAVNQGIAAARPDSDIILLNNDAVIQPGSLAALQRACYSLPDAGMTVPRQILPASTKTIRTHVPYANEQRDCDVNVSAHHRNIRSIETFHDGQALELLYAPFFAVYIRRDLIDRIGPLDAEYGRHYRSDRVYCDMTLNTTPYRIYYVPEAFVVHKLQKSTDSLRDNSKDGKDFELMFKRNQWDQDTAKEFGFRFPAWDIF